MREQLIRYLLGELDDDERQHVQSLLREKPELQRELARLRQCFAMNQEEDLPPVPPRGLARRTAQFISDSDEYEIADAATRVGTMTSAGDPPAGVLGWSLADLSVAFGVMLAVSMLVFPALRDSREGTRRNVCANNLMEFGKLFCGWSERHNRDFPQVRPNETAGVFAARLVEEGDISPEDLAPLLICPAAPLAREVRAQRLVIWVPSAQAIRAMSPAQLARVTAQISPFYAYRMPYQAAGELRYVRDERSPYAPLLSDTAGDAANAMSLNHGGSILQVLCQDGHVRVLNTYILPEMNDDLFHNNVGRVGVGLGPLDAVLAPSDTMPQIEPAGQLGD